MSQGQSAALKQEEFRGDQLKLGIAPCWGDTEITSVPSRIVKQDKLEGKYFFFYLPSRDRMEWRI